MEKMRDWTVMKKKEIGNRHVMKNKEGEYSQRVWFSEAAKMEGWQDLVFYFCYGKKQRQ